MAESIENKRSHLRCGISASNNATFRFFDLKSNLMFLLRRIANKTLCHSELGSESHKCIEVKSSIPSYCANEVRCGIFRNLKKAFAFTLAETLIVMGIIGVVAALTIPNLNSSTADKEKVAKIKKIYSNLNDALGRAQAVYGPAEEWAQLDSTEDAQTARFGDRLTEFMKVSKNCKMEVNKGCFSSAKAKPLMGSSNGVDSLDKNNNYYKFITADGTSMYFAYGGGIVDIDGPIKGPNQFGKDLFQFLMDENGFVPSRRANMSFYIDDFTDWVGLAASGWIIDYDNMDYLKLTKDGKCPNGTTPTEQNPRCK